MADWYVWSGATGGGTGADWANAYINLSSISAKAAGDRFFVAHDHVQTQASALTITAPGTEALPSRIYCVNRAGTVPPVAADLRTTATVSTTGAFAITLAGSVAECYGILFSAADAAANGSLNVNSTNGRTWRLVNCGFRLNTTSGSPRITFCTGAGNNACILENCTLQLGAVGQRVDTTGRTIWRGGALIGTIAPTNLFGMGGGGALWFVEGVDLSLMTPGTKALFAQTTNVPNGIGIIKDCKLGASVVIIVPPTSSYGNHEITVIRSDSGDTNYRTEKYTYAGAITTETTIVLTGGASDGGQPISWKFVTTVNSEFEFPLESLPITIWNESVGSPKTVTLQGIWATGALPKNDDIWIDVAYLGTAGFPIASRVSSKKATALTANADVAAGAGTWGGGTTAFSLAVTFTPQEKGPVTIYVNAAKVSSTFYVDPKPVIT